MNSLPVLSLDPMVSVGFIGALIVGVGFVLNQLRVWKSYDFEYDFINLLGGLILAFYGYKTNDWPIFVLFTIWVLFSLKDCIFDYQHRMDWQDEAMEEVKKLKDEKKPAKPKKVVTEKRATAAKKQKATKKK